MTDIKIYGFTNRSHFLPTLFIDQQLDVIEKKLLAYLDSAALNYPKISLNLSLHLTPSLSHQHLYTSASHCRNQRMNGIFY